MPTGLDATAVEVPHSSESLSLILILPGKQREFIAGGLSRLEARLLQSADAWPSLLRCLRPIKLDDLRVPAFKHHSELQLKSTLEAMGVKDAFEEGVADFGGVNGQSNDLWLTSFYQANEFSFVDNSEQDSERRKRQAGSSEGATSTVYKLHFNRQFLYALRHNPTGVILNLGRYYQPHGHGHHGHHGHHGDHGHHGHHGDHHGDHHDEHHH